MLLDGIMPIILEGKKLPIPQVYLAHVKIEDPLYETNGEPKKPGYRAIAAQGSHEDQMKRWFDHILHIMVSEDQKHTIFIQPTIYKNYRITAKDRHQTFASLGNGRFTLMLGKNGYPDT